MSKIKLASLVDCTGCLACIDACGKKAIKFEYRVDGHLYPKIQTDKCVGCHKCVSVCPVVNEKAYGNNNDKDKTSIYAAWINDREVRRKSASGGVFAAVAISFLKNGDYVCGVKLEGTEAKHVIIDKMEDLKFIQGSKYLQSNISGIYKKVRDILKRGDKKVLFSGTPCQVAGLLSYVGNVGVERLFCVDIVCGGVPSRLLVDRLRKTYPKIKSIVSFRDKDDSWKPHGFCYSLKIETEDGIIRIPNNQNLLIEGFSHSLTNRNSCYHCKFSYLHRRADVTIGDFWGYKQDVDVKDGISLLLVHSSKASDLLNKLDLTLVRSDVSAAIKCNKRVVYGHKYLYKLFPSRLCMPQLFTLASDKVLAKLFCIQISNTDGVYVLFKLLYILILKINYIIFRVRYGKY